jgi:hypothetical protein
VNIVMNLRVPNNRRGVPLPAKQLENVETRHEIVNRDRSQTYPMTCKLTTTGTGTVRNSEVI